MQTAIVAIKHRRMAAFMDVENAAIAKKPYA